MTDCEEQACGKKIEEWNFPIQNTDADSKSKIKSG